MATSDQHSVSGGSSPSDSICSNESDPLVPHEQRNTKKWVLKKVAKWVKTNLLLILTIASVIIGTIIGVCIREAKLDREGYRLMVELVSFPGEIFLRMLKMLILPLIVFSLIAGLGSLEAKVAGSLGWKTVLYYGTTTLLAVGLGLILVSTIKPGSRGFDVECNNATHGLVNELDTLDSILDLLRNMLPDNLFAATFQQSETHYTHEYVTDFKLCLNTSGEEEASNDTCQAIQDSIQELNISCVNATEKIRHISIRPRDGMNVLGIIVFTIVFGITLGRLGEGGRSIVRVIGVLNEAIMRLVTLVMWYSPIGIASIIAGKLAEVESFSVLIEQIGLYFVTVLVGLCIHGCIILPLIYIIMTRSNPLKIVKAVLQALLTAFGTSSSAATLPITIQNLEDNFGSDPRVTRFMLPVGATINMDGTALYEAVAAVFIAQVEGVTTTAAKLIIISITATCASIGAAGVPQAGLFTLLIVIVAVGLDPENVGLILAVDWLLDRFRTTVNVLGDTFGVGIVEHYSRKQLGPPPPKSTDPSTNPDPPSDGLPPAPRSPDLPTKGVVTAMNFTETSNNSSSASSPKVHWTTSTRSHDPNNMKPQVYMSVVDDGSADEHDSDHVTDHVTKRFGTSREGGSLPKEETNL